MMRSKFVHVKNTQKVFIKQWSLVVKDLDPAFCGGVWPSDISFCISSQTTL